MVRTSPVPKNQDVERIQNDIKITTQNITGTDTMGKKEGPTSPPDSTLPLPVKVLLSEPTPAPIVPAFTMPLLPLPPTVQPVTTILPNNNEDITDIDNDGWMDGNNRVKRQVMLANDPNWNRDGEICKKFHLIVNASIKADLVLTCDAEIFKSDDEIFYVYNYIEE